MKIGLYLAYGPFPPKASIKNEGLGRYLALLIRNFLQDGHTIILACPSWFREILNELLTDYAIPIENLELVTTTSDPFVLKLYYKYKLNKYGKKTKWRGRLSETSNKLFEWFLDIFLSIKGLGFFIAFSLGVVFLSLISLPFLIILSLIVLILRIINWLAKKIFKMSFRFTVKGFMKKLLSLPGISIVYRKMLHVISSTDLRESLRSKAAKELLQRIHRLKSPPDIWYCPTAFWPEFGSIDGVAVTCIPDIVIDEFGLEFSRYPSSKKYSEVLGNTIRNCRYFITYCDFIKQTVLIDRFRIASECVTPIMMFTNEMHPYIDVQSSFPHHPNANQLFAKDILDNARIYLINPINPQYMESDVWISIKDVKYIFYSSQVRPHKNILNLIKAYEYLLRREKVSCKLFLTGKYFDDAQLFQYIQEHQLQNEIFCFFNVPNQTLAALYACAELCVNPTLYEGGFPFTLSEGMSVGTQSIMSRIPQVTEFTDGWAIDECLFDPYDYKDIANKILYGLGNRELLIKKQTPLYRAHSLRTTSGQAGREYIAAFENFIKLNKKAEKIDDQKV